MKKQLLILTSLSLIIILLVAGVSYAVSPEKQATICAEENFSNYLGIIEGCATDFDFSTEADLEKAYLGKPIPHIRISNSDFDLEKKLKDQAEAFAFYHFPVMVDNKAVTDFTVCLEKGEWHPVDIGGCLCAVIDEVAQKNSIAYEDSVILNFAGENYILVNKGGEEFCYLPYHHSNEIAEKELVSSDKFKKIVMQEKIDLVYRIKQMQAESPDNPISTGPLDCQSLPVEQASVTTRLINYIIHVF